MSEKAEVYVGLSLFTIYNMMVQWWWIDEGRDGRKGGWTSDRVAVEA